MIDQDDFFLSFKNKKIDSKNRISDIVRVVCYEIVPTIFTQIKNWLFIFHWQLRDATRRCVSDHISNFYELKTPDQSDKKKFLMNTWLNLNLVKCIKSAKNVLLLAMNQPSLLLSTYNLFLVFIRLKRYWNIEIVYIYTKKCELIYRYYYSIALLVMQYLIPLMVLMFTYTSIAVVVWGKQIPGEAENTRDLRMARSKRKVSKQISNNLIILDWRKFTENLKWRVLFLKFIILFRETIMCSI